MPERNSPVRRSPRSGNGTWVTRQAACAALLLLFVSPASAQVLDTITLETSEGEIIVDLYDFPDVVEHAKHFRESQSRLSNGFFHRGDKVRFCDESYCFYCVCNASLMCQDDPNERTCETEGDEFWIVDDDTEPAPYVQAGRFYLDENYAIDEFPDDLPAGLQDAVPTFSNTAFTLAYVRVQDSPTTTKLTSEWIINLENNPELDDPFDEDLPDFDNGYLVFGAVVLGQEVAAQIGGQKTYDAAEDPDVLANATPSPEQLEQVPVFESFSGEPGAGDTFIDPCDPGDPDYDDCLMPACDVPTPDDLACEDPRCVELVPLTEEEQEMVDLGEEVPRFCSTPVLPAFPILIPEPSALLSGLGALAALAGLARRRSRARPRGDALSFSGPPR